MREILAFQFKRNNARNRWESPNFNAICLNCFSKDLRPRPGKYKLIINMARRLIPTKFSFALSYTKLVRSKYFQRINGRRVTCTKQADLKAVCPEYSMIDLRAFPLKIWIYNRPSQILLAAAFRSFYSDLRR